MKRIRMRKIQASMLIWVMVLLSGCGKADTQMDTSLKEIEIPITFLVNPDTGENENQELVDAFNEEYEGVYRLSVEWITDTAEGYRARIKTLNGLDKLPAVITDAGFDADFYELLIKNDRLTDLKPYIMADEQWKTAYGDRELNTYKEEGGEIYLCPSGNKSLSFGGFYYNKELFEQAGIESFPDNWDDFFKCLETLKGKGITPLALHGGSSYWTALLIATGYTAGTDKGLEFLNIQYPKNYQNESAKELFLILKRLYEYTYSDALHIERTESARRFVQKEAAITANGGWMILNFTDEEKNGIGFAPFPENVLMEDMKMSAWAVTTGYSEDVTKGAAEFLKFRALRDKVQETEYFDEEAKHIVEKEYKQTVLKADTIMPNYQLKWEIGIQEEFLVNVLPLYIEDEITQEEFLLRLNEAVQNIDEEK